MSEQIFLIAEIILHLIFIATIIYILVRLPPLCFSFITIFFSRPKSFGSSVSDDWPPEGTLHFIDVTEFKRNLALSHEFTPPPETHKVFQFASNWGEVDENVIALGIEIIQQLCQKKTILATVTSYAYKNSSKKRKFIPAEPFILRYHRYLQHVSPSMSTYLEGEGIYKLSFLCNDFHTESHYAFEEFCQESWHFDYYVFTSTLPVDAQTAFHAAQENQYDLYLNLYTYPHSLDITFDPRTVDIATIQAVVDDVCKTHGIVLQNPPEH